MKRQIVILLLVTLLVCVGLSGCLSSEEGKLIGRWRQSNAEIGGTFLGTELSFYTEGISKKVDYIVMGMSYKLDWKIEHNRIIVSGDVQNVALEWEYHLNGNNELVVSIMPGLPITLNKVGSVEINPEDGSNSNNNSYQLWTDGNITLQDIQYYEAYNSKYGDYRNVEVWLRIDYDVFIETQMKDLYLITNNGNIISCACNSIGTNGKNWDDLSQYITISLSKSNSPGYFNLFLRNNVDPRGNSNANMLMIDENVTSFTFTIVDAYGSTKNTVKISDNMISNRIQENISEKFIGTWKSETSGTISTFYYDGTYITAGTTYQWSLEFNRFIVEIGGTDYTYSFSNTNTTLTLNNTYAGTTLIYTKQ